VSDVSEDTVLETWPTAPADAPRGGAAPAGAAWVLEALEPDQLVAAKAQRFGRRRLDARTRALMWGLRGYVIFMLVVVGYQVWTAVHGGGS
jgi:hypothetical protein